MTPLQVRAKYRVRLKGEGIRRVRGCPYAWDTLVLLRRSILMGLSTSLFWFRKPLSALLVALGLLIVSLSMQAHISPYGTAALNALEVLSILGQITFTSAVVLQVPGASGTSSTFGFGLLAVSAQAPFYALWLLVLVDTVFFDGALGRGIAEKIREIRVRFWVVDPVLAAQAAAVLEEAAKATDAAKCNDSGSEAASNSEDDEEEEGEEEGSDHEDGDADRDGGEETGRDTKAEPPGRSS